MKQVTAVIGNSSSGIIEAPSAPTATINIGDRQKGRIQAESIINCAAIKEDIINAFNIVKTEDFRHKIDKVVILTVTECIKSDFRCIKISKD